MLLARVLSSPTQRTAMIRPVEVWREHALSFFFPKREAVPATHPRSPSAGSHYPGGAGPNFH